MSAQHAHFSLHEPKFVADLEERLLDRHHEHHHAAAHPHHPPRLVPAIPDLRFEFSYLRSVQPYVKIMRITEVEPLSQPTSRKTESPAALDSSYEKIQFGSEEGREESGASTAVVTSTKEVIEVQWGKVLWVTTRDQVLSPLIQGALWALASHYITPFSWGLGSKLGSAVHDRVATPVKEGSIVTWLRSLFTPSTKTPRSRLA